MISAILENDDWLCDMVWEAMQMTHKHDFQRDTWHDFLVCKCGAVVSILEIKHKYSQHGSLDIDPIEAAERLADKIDALKNGTD